MRNDGYDEYLYLYSVYLWKYDFKIYETQPHTIIQHYHVSISTNVNSHFRLHCKRSYCWLEKYIIGLVYVNNLIWLV